MKRVVGIGAAVYDTLIEMSHFPEEDVKIRAERVFSSGGGPVSNALVCLAKLGVGASYLGLLSDDEIGHRLKEEFERFGVDASEARFLKGYAPFTSYIILSKDNGTRTCLFDKGNVPDDPSQLSFTALSSADVLHLDGNNLETAKAGIKEAKRLGVKVSLDAGSVYPHIEDILPDIDILIPSEEFALRYTGKKTAEEALLALNEAFHPEVLLITQGVKGGIFLEGKSIKHYDAFQVECVDSNGAGDTFHGAFLAAYLEGKDIGEAARFASAVSALKCQKAGMRTALPSLEATLDFLRERR